MFRIYSRLNQNIQPPTAPPSATIRTREAVPVGRRRDDEGLRWLQRAAVTGAETMRPRL